MRKILWGSGIGIVLCGAVFVYVASSPWLTWFTLPHTAHKIVVFSPHVPVSLLGNEVQAFISVWDRWHYVATYRSWPAWWETLKTLAWKPVPLYPAALIETDQWFSEPTLIMATRSGKELKLVAQSADAESGPQRLGRVDAAPAADLAVTVPGEALLSLPVSLRESWNRLLHERLGFTVTTPDILGELATYSRITMSIESAEASVGVVAPSEAEQKRWEATSTRWVVDEDRFRRPLEQDFRLPDGTRGRERVAGLPRQVFRDERIGACRTPLPEVPELYTCEGGKQFMIANYAWTESAAFARTFPDWQMTLGPAFLGFVPELASIQLQGSGTRAAGILRVK